VFHSRDPYASGVMSYGLRPRKTMRAFLPSQPPSYEARMQIATRILLGDLRLACLGTCGVKRLLATTSAWIQKAGHPSHKKIEMHLNEFCFLCRDLVTKTALED